MSISSNDSILNTPPYEGGPGWVWGGGDAGWVYQGSYDQASEQPSSSLAQTLLAGLQQQQSPPQQDWFAQANSMAMAAMVAAQTSSASATPAQVLTGHDAGLGALGLDAVAYSPSEAYSPPPAAQNIFNASPAEGWVWGGGDAGWNYQPSSNDLLSTAITAAWNHEQQTTAHVATIAAAGSTLGALANGLLMNQAANGSTHSPSDKSLGTIKTGANPPATAGAARTQSTATNNSSANSNAGTPNTLTRADTPPRPQARTGELWEGGQGVATLWSQYQADPYRLMQTMAEYGVSAQEIAQASGQSLDDITAYLSRAGAPVGFAGANIIDRDAVDRAFLAALDQASQASTPPGMGSTFDVQAFSSWYAAQDTQASREFARLHGANFSQSQAIAVAGQWQGGGDSGVWTWQGGQLARQGQTASSQSQIANYLSYSQASAQELQSVDFMLGDQINQDLLAHFGSDIPLPNSEYVERMRARYGSERAEQMYRIMQASGAVRQAYADAVNAQQIQQPWPEEIQSQSTAPGVQLNHQETQYTSASQPWWSVTHHVEHDNTFSTVNFNLQAYTDWYAAQDTPASRLFEQLYGSQLTTVEHRENRGEGDIHEWSNTYIGAGGASEILLGNYQASGDQGERWEQAHATDYGISASSVAMDGDMKLFDAGAITFDPVMGFVTAHDNINNSDWTDMILPVFVGAVAGAFLGPLAAQGVGFTAGTTAGSIAAVGFGGAIGSAFSGLMATGSIDFEQVLKSALTAVLTAGFAELTGIQDAGLLTDARGNVVLINGVQVVTDWGTRIASMGVQAAFSGIVSDLMGGDFSQGFVQSVASQLGREIMNAVHGEIRNSSTPLTAHEQAAYNLMGRGLSAALTIAANPDNPMQALALGFISEIGAGLGNAVGSVNTRPTNWADTPVNGLTEDDGWTVSGGGNSGTSGGGNTSTASNTNTSSGGMTEADYWNSPGVSIATHYVDTYGGQITQVDFVRNNGEYVTTTNEPVPAGTLRVDSSAPTVPQGLLPQGVSSNSVYGVRDQAGNLYYAIDGSNTIYEAALFTGAAQNILSQGTQGLQTGAITPSQFLDASRFVNAFGDNLPQAPQPNQIPFRVEVTVTREDLLNNWGRRLGGLGITPIADVNDFMGPLTHAQNAVAQQTGWVVSDIQASQLTHLSSQGLIDWWPANPGASALAGTGALPLTLGALTAGGSRVLVAGAELLADLALTARSLAPWALLLVPGNAQEQIVNIDDGQRFVTRPGELYGNLQQLGPDGNWFISASGVALVDVGGRRVALTPEQLAELNRPFTTPNNPRPNLQLINVPLRPQDQPSPLIPGQSTDQRPPPTNTTTPAEPVLTWEDLIVTSEGNGNNDGVFTPSRTNPTGQIGGVAQGDRTPSRSNASSGNRADIRAENDALDVVAGYGYRTERNPVLTPQERAAQGLSDTSNPDARIEGRVFDVKASTSPQSAESAIARSLGEGQSRRFIISTEHFANPDAGARELAVRLRSNPMPGLQEVKVIVNGVLRNIYP